MKKLKRMKKGKKEFQQNVFWNTLFCNEWKSAQITYKVHITLRLFNAFYRLKNLFFTNEKGILLAMNIHQRVSWLKRNIYYLSIWRTNFNIKWQWTIILICVLKFVLTKKTRWKKWHDCFNGCIIQTQRLEKDFSFILK